MSQQTGTSSSVEWSHVHWSAEDQTILLNQIATYRPHRAPNKGNKWEKVRDALQKHDSFTRKEIGVSALQREFDRLLGDDANARSAKVIELVQELREDQDVTTIPKVSRKKPSSKATRPSQAMLNAIEINEIQNSTSNIQNSSSNAPPELHKAKKARREEPEEDFRTAFSGLTQLFKQNEELQAEVAKKKLQLLDYQIADARKKSEKQQDLKRKKKRHRRHHSSSSSPSSSSSSSEEPL